MAHGETKDGRHWLAMEWLDKDLGRVKLLDFGMARVADSMLSKDPADRPADGAAVARAARVILRRARPIAEAG